MIIDDPNDMDDIERKIKFEEIARQFGRSIAAFECAPYISEFELMKRQGLICPPPDEVDELDDDAVSDLLWKVIDYQARRNTFPSPTDHLSDRELYRRLYEVAEEEPARDWEAVLDPHELTQVGSWNQHIDLLPLETDEEVKTYARCYLKDDDKARKEYATFLCEPGDLPPYQGAPYDRDRFMPRPLEERLEAIGEKPAPSQQFDDGETDPHYADEFGLDEFGNPFGPTDPPSPRRRRIDGEFDDNDIPF